MNFDREDFEKAQKANQTAPDAREVRRQLSHLHQSGLSADAMTSDPAWNIFLQYLQSVKEQNTSQRDSLMADMMSPAMVNADEIAKRRIAIIRLNERIELLTAIIVMPAEIKRVGNIASERLKKLAEIEGEAA